MKYIFLLLIHLFSISIGFGQENYTKSMDHSFSGGNNGGWTGNHISEVVRSINSLDGIMNVAVNKAPGSESILGQYVAGCWVDFMVYDQTNRFVAFRVKCDVAQTTPMKFYPRWGVNCDGCCAENKTFSPITFTIPEANKWTTVFLEIPQSAGGTQNIVDTMTWWNGFELANGNYQFDYIKMGLAAVPPPTIDPIKNKSFVGSYGKQFTNLSGISLPGKSTLDGLTIEAKSKCGFVDSVSLVDTGNGPFYTDTITNLAYAVVQYNPIIGFSGFSDSIIIILTDTVRGTSTRTGFLVSYLSFADTYYSCWNDIAMNETIIQIYPAPFSDFFTIKFPELFTGEITIWNITGNLAATRKIDSESSVSIYLSNDPGLYFVKISDGKDVVIRKIVKQ